MDVIAICAQKGGTGKTTLALSLAVAAQLAGKTAALIDLDPQATASNWGDRRSQETPVIQATLPPRLPHVLKAAEDAGANFVVIDTPPRAEQAALAAAKVANLVLIPCRPAVFDLDTLATTLELIRHAGPQPVAAVLNAVPARGPKREQAGDVIKDLGLAVIPAVLGYRTAFADAVALGLSPQEHEPGGKAAQEIEQVYRFVCKLLKETTRKGVNQYGQERRSASGDAR